MKKDNIVINKFKTSFQSQLFIIVLFIFIIFILFEYMVTENTIKNKYVDNQANETLETAEELVGIDSSSLFNKLYEFKNKTNYIPLVINTINGFELEDSIYTNYKIKVGTTIFKVNDYSLTFNINQNIEDIYYKDSNGEYILESYKFNDQTYINKNNENSSYLESGTISEIYKPINLNYLYETEDILEKIEFVKNNITKFNEKDNIKYYSSNNILYTLIENEDNQILLISSLVNTKTLRDNISLNFGYIAFASTIVAVLLALFISYAFSKPIKRIEEEMNNLSNGNYEKTDYNFKNSELSSLEDTLNKVKDDTKERVNELENKSKKLKIMNDRILKENELRKSFIQRLSHELKTPLMVIGATTEALSDGMIDKNNIKDEYKNILDEVDKSNSIIKDIIQTYKNTNTELILKEERFSLDDVVNDVVKSLKSLEDKNHLNVNIKLNKCFIIGDINLIHDVVSNFITNAYKYTQDKGIVDINIIDTNECVLFEVINYGSHIKEDNLDKIFLPFYRENENVDSSSTGMGLYIVKEILDAHKFEYKVENIENGVRSYFKYKK